MTMENDAKYKLMELYCRKHNSPDDYHSTNKNKLLREHCLNYLLSSEDQFPLRHSDDYQKVLGRCCADDGWQPRKTEKALKVLEQYALNVYKYPWKREFSSIKTYTGYFCTRINPYVPDVRRLLSHIGYNATYQDDSILSLSAQAIEKHEQVLSTAFTFWLLQNECEILSIIYSKVLEKIPSTQKVDGLYHDVHRCRASITISSSINDCVEAVIRKRNVVSRSNGVVTSGPIVQLPPFTCDICPEVDIVLDVPSKFRDTARSKRSISPREQARLETAASVILTSTPRPYSSILPVLRKVSYKVNEGAILNRTIRPKVVFNDNNEEYMFSERDVIAQSSPEKLFENRNSTDYAREVASKARQSKRFSIYDNEPVTML